MANRRSSALTHNEPPPLLQSGRQRLTAQCDGRADSFPPTDPNKAGSVARCSRGVFWELAGSLSNTSPFPLLDFRGPLATAGAQLILVGGGGGWGGAASVDTGIITIRAASVHVRSEITHSWPWWSKDAVPPPMNGRFEWFGF